MLRSSEIFNLRNSFERNRAYGDVLCREIVNPCVTLREKEKERLVMAASEVLFETTSENFVNKSGKDGVYKYLFGMSNRGKVLFVFEDYEKMIGFSSVNILNDGESYFRFKRSTILHLGTGHILPKYQGNNFVYRAVMDYIGEVESSLKPKYIDGFTQSPRLLRMLTRMSLGRIVPNLSGNNEELMEGQQFVLKIVEGMNFNDRILNKFVVRGKAEGTIYKEKLTSGDQRFDEFFYQELGVRSEAGDLIHFFGEFG